MKYPLQDLIGIRQIRVDKADLEIRKARKLLEEAHQLVEQRKQELIDYRRWRLEEEERLLDSIMNRPVKREDIDDIKTQIAGLRNREVDYEKRIEEAKQGVVEAEKNLEKAIENHRIARKELQKIQEHKGEWIIEALEEAEKEVEKEAEDFRTISRLPKSGPAPDQSEATPPQP